MHTKFITNGRSPFISAILLSFILKVELLFLNARKSCISLPVCLSACLSWQEKLWPIGELVATFGKNANRWPNKQRIQSGKSEINQLGSIYMSRLRCLIDRTSQPTWSAFLSRFLSISLSRSLRLLCSISLGDFCVQWHQLLTNSPAKYGQPYITG